MSKRKKRRGEVEEGGGARGCKRMRRGERGDRRARTGV